MWLGLCAMGILKAYNLYRDHLIDSYIWDRILVQGAFTEIDKALRLIAPLLIGSDLVGRVDLARDRKVNLLMVKGIFWEDGFKPDSGFLMKLAVELKNHADFTGMNGVNLPQKRSKELIALKKLV